MSEQTKIRLVGYTTLVVIILIYLKYFGVL